jgi:serine phosphatase RsbU (regulator of sigma subunit)
MSRLANVVEDRLLSLVISRSDGALLSPTTLQRLLGFLFVTGASIGVFSMLFPQPPGTSIPGLFLVYGLAYAFGALLLAGRGRLPNAINHVSLAFGSTLVTLAIHFTDGRTGVYSMFYVWVSITAWYFFDWTRAWIQIAVIAALFAGVLVWESPAGAEEEWIITAGTVTVAGLLVGALRRSVQRLIEDLEEAHRTDHARLYAAEREARLEADRATESLRRLQQVTDVALSHLQLDDLLRELLTRVKGMLGVDIAAIALEEPASGVMTISATSGLPADLSDLRLRRGEGFVGRVAEARRPIVIDQLRDSDVIPPLRGIGIKSLMGIPLIVEGRVTGVMPIGSFTQRTFTPEEVRLTQLAADRMAIAIENARLYQREHRIAETLQRSLLPNTLPSVPGLAVAARYLPARLETQVGGDWYDVLALPGGGLALSIGDVSGHGVEAAALMSQLRNGLRAAALEGTGVAAAVQRVDALLQSQRQRDDSIATAVFARLNGDGTGLELSSAGHLPPLVAQPDGEVHFLDEARSVPLGVPAHVERRSYSCTLSRGSMLLLYTDGLVERRGTPITDGLERLADAARSMGTDPEAACDRVVRAMLGGEGPADDVAVLAVAVDGRPASG